MVRPGRDLLTGRVEVDECYIGGLEEGLPGRLNSDKALIVVAAQEDGPGIGRIRMRQIVDASAASLVPFVLRVGRFHHIYNVKVTQGGITIFPGDTATLPLDLLRYRLGYVLEVL